MTKTEQTRLWTWRFKVLQRAGESSRNVARTCRHFGISRKSFYKWQRRFDQLGAAGLYDRPRTPHRSPHATPREVVSKILYLRQHYHFPGHVPERPTSCRTFLLAHQDVIAGGDFFTTEVWTWRGLVTVYTVFVINLASRRVQILRSTAHPDEAFKRQVGRTLTMADADTCVLICDRNDRAGRFAGAYSRRESDRADAVSSAQRECHFERFVRSIKEECLNRIIPIGSVISASGARIRGAPASRAESSGTREQVDRRCPDAHRRPDSSSAADGT